MPVGTRGTVKAIDMEDLRRLAPPVVLMNAYHLWTAPGAAAVAAAGGLHAFTGWSGNILTDSGGFQAVSLARAGAARVDEDGVHFEADGGDGRLLSPERAIEVQSLLAPDVMMALDQPVPYGSTAAETEAATARTHRWAERCLTAWGRGPVELFGIVQGGFDPVLRRQSAAIVGGMGFPGHAIGGLSLGERPGTSDSLTRVVNAILAPDRPRYLMGVGSEPELLAGIAAGVDMFDCVWPTRLARTGSVLVGAGRLNLRAAASADNFGPIEPGCTCPTCTGHTRSQLRYLFQRGELLAHRLATIHNLHHLLELMRQARTAILAGAFEDFRASRLAAPVG